MKKVLVVEDDPFIISIYIGQLKKEGFDVDGAETVEKALEKIKSFKPDAMVLDMNLSVSSPGPKDGLDILKAVRANPESKGVKVVVASNYSLQEYPELAELNELGVAKIFLKIEASPDDIAATLKELVM